MENSMEIPYKTKTRAIMYVCVRVCVCVHGQLCLTFCDRTDQSL